MNSAAPTEAVRSALNDATHSLLAVLDRTHLSVAENARLRATAMLQNALVLTDPHLPDNPIIYANPAFLELSGYPKEEIVGFNCRFLQGTLTDRAEVDRLKEAIKREQPVQVTLLNYRKDGTHFWNELTVAPVRDDAGALTHFVAVQTDVTVLKESEAALKKTEASLLESEHRLRIALESGRLGAWHLDLVTDKFLEVSAIWRSHFGLAPDAEVTRTQAFEAVHPDDKERVWQTLQQALAARCDYQAEYRVLWPDESLHWISSHATLTYTAAGAPRYLIGLTQDVTARKQQEAEMKQALREAEERADCDPLTGLLNHRAFQKKLEDETARAQREGTSLAVVMLDLDGFKFFNDVYGHLIGDDVLRQMAKQLQAVCRSYDTVARFGGDEFALLLPGSSQSTSNQSTPADLEARLRAELGVISFHPEGQPTTIPITISVGVAFVSPLNLDWHRALQQADERLLRSKTGGEAETEADAVRLSAQVHIIGFPMLDALVTAVDNKDRYTCRHSEDVLNYSLMIGRELGLDTVQQQTIAVAALLHDVGKIGVPDATLRKPGKLTEEEFEAIKQHPTMGAALVSTVSGLEGTLEAVRHHHERWDGSGYPSGLKEKETPLMARLMAVADAFSAMTTDRPYRQGMDRAKALAILDAGSGTQWDPECVAALLKALP